MTKAEMLSRLEKAQILIDSVMMVLPDTDEAQETFFLLVEANNNITDAQHIIFELGELE